MNISNCIKFLLVENHDKIHDRWYSSQGVSERVRLG